MKKLKNKPPTTLKEKNVKRQKLLLLRKINSKVVRGKKQGLILIELLVAMAIFAISIITIFSLFTNATQGVMVGLEKNRGEFLSNEILEAFYAISQNDSSYLTPGKYEVGINNNNQWVLIPKSGLMGHFLLANNVKDSSIYKNETIANQISFFEDRKNEPGGAARFTGNNYIKTKYAFSLQIEGPLTLTAWVLDTHPKKEEKRTIASKSVYKLYKENDEYYFAITGPNGEDSISATSDYLPWEHIVGVYDPGGPTLSIYVNGEKKETRTTNIASIKNVPEIEFFIGADPDETGEPSNFWNGRISDVRVYKRSLTANEISGLYNDYSAPYEKSLAISDPIFDWDEKTKTWKFNEKVLAGTWNFNEGEGCLIHDNSRNNNHGIIKNCSQEQWIEDRHKKEKRAFLFNESRGENNFIEIADSPSLQIKGEISISLWIKMPETLPEKDMTIFHKRASGSEDFSFALIYDFEEVENKKNYRWLWSASTGAPDEFSDTQLADFIAPNSWQNIILTFDGQNKKIYINNKEIITSKGSTINNSGSSSNLFIGQNTGGQNPSLGINIDDFKIYNRVLRDAERQAIFLGKTNHYLE